MNTTMLSFMPVAACNMNCPNCTQAPWRKDFPTYQMTPDEVEAICRRVAEQGLHFAWAHITGGEAALWQYLKEGCQIIRQSGCFDHTEIWTNCRKTTMIKEVVDTGLVDRLCTQSANADKRGIKSYLNNGYPLTVIDPSEHRVHPDKPLDNVLPAACGCNRLMVMQGRLWPCANAYSNLRRMGASKDKASIVSIPIEDDWNIIGDSDRFNMHACRICLANGKVWNQASTGKVR